MFNQNELSLLYTAVENQIWDLERNKPAHPANKTVNQHLISDYKDLLKQLDKIQQGA